MIKIMKEDRERAHKKTNEEVDKYNVDNGWGHVEEIV